MRYNNTYHLQGKIKTSGGQIWLAGEGFDREEKGKRKREKWPLVRGGIFIQLVKGGRVQSRLSRSAGTRPMRVMRLCWPGPRPSCSNQLRPLGEGRREERHRSRSESRPERRESRGDGAKGTEGTQRTRFDCFHTGKGSVQPALGMECTTHHQCTTEARLHCC